MAEDFLQSCDIFCLTKIKGCKGVSTNFMSKDFIDASYGCNLFEVAVHGLVRQKFFEDWAFLPGTDDIRHQHLEGVGDRHDNRFRLRVAEFDAVVGEGCRAELLQLEMLGITYMQTAEA